jgi:hypothetical protein
MVGDFAGVRLSAAGVGRDAPLECTPFRANAPMNAPIRSKTHGSSQYSAKTKSSVLIVVHAVPVTLYLVVKAAENCLGCHAIKGADRTAGVLRDGTVS